MLERSDDCLNIPRSYDYSLHAIAHYIARLARGDLRETAGGRLIGNLGAAFPVRRKNMDRALAEIILRIRHKSHDTNVIAPELLEIRLRLVVDVTDKPQLGVWQIQAMPCFEHVLNALAFNQCAGKNRTEFRRALTWLEALHVH